MTFVVVVAHIVSGGFIGYVNFFLGNFDVLARRLTTVFDFVSRVDAAAVLSLCDVDLGFKSSIPRVLAVDLDVDSVVFCWTSVAFARELYFGVLVVTSVVAFSRKFNLRILLIFLSVDANILFLLAMRTFVSDFDVNLLTSIFPSDA